MIKARTLDRMRVITVIAAVGLLVSPVAWAQQASGIAGLVRDTSGAVLPGATVEATSPALIEKSRTAVTDGEGRYNIVDLRPGTYAVTFTLTGFTTIKREGIQLSAGFTAPLNVDMQVGSVSETLTVTGASPLVDTQHTNQQSVFSHDVLNVMPSSSKSQATFVMLVPGVAGPTSVGGASGTYWDAGALTDAKYHGKVGSRWLFDGSRIDIIGNGSGYMVNDFAVQETTVETGGVSAESETSGISLNSIPKAGGNNFSFGGSFLGTGPGLQSDNLTDELRARGLTRSNKIVKIWDNGGWFGGPIQKDRLWFFTAHRWWGNETSDGTYWNKTQHTPFYTPDFSRPSFTESEVQSHSVDLTWQASPRNRFSFFADPQKACNCRLPGNWAPEAFFNLQFGPDAVYQAKWTSAVSNKLLLEAQTSFLLFSWPDKYQPGTLPTDVSILELSTGFAYNGEPYGHLYREDEKRYGQRFTASYVTGSHTFKAGFNLYEGDKIEGVDQSLNQNQLFFNGVPVGLIEHATPYETHDRVKADLGVYAQDQWTFRRLTLNLGIRFDYYNGEVPAQNIPATALVPARNFAALACVPCWKDFDPRIGAAYDLFGDGRTALKVHFGRYVEKHGRLVTAGVNPVNTSVSSTFRTWTDNGNYVVDCDLANPAANGECGQIADTNFGKNDPNATVFSNAVLNGLRTPFIELGAEVQHQFTAGVSMTAGYYRNSTSRVVGGSSLNPLTDANSGDRIFQNLATSPTDYSPYCVPAPLDPRLPGGGGYPVCGLYDINPNKYGQVQNIVTSVYNFGTPTLVNNFFAIGLETRRVSGLQFGGGLDTGRTASNTCFVVNSPQELLNCNLVTPWAANTRIKLHGSYALPFEFVVSGVFQNIPGPEIQANWPAPNALVAPSLGRDLSGGAQVVTAQSGTGLLGGGVPLIKPWSMYEPRITQLDLRLAKFFKIGRARVQANVDVYNALNAGGILGTNPTYGPDWRKPVVTAIFLNPTPIQPGRLIEFTGQLTF